MSLKLSSTGLGLHSNNLKPKRESCLFFEQGLNGSFPSSIQNDFELLCSRVFPVSVRSSITTLRLSSMLLCVCKSEIILYYRGWYYQMHKWRFQCTSNLLRINFQTDSNLIYFRDTKHHQHPRHTQQTGECENEDYYA